MNANYTHRVGSLRHRAYREFVRVFGPFVFRRSRSGLPISLSVARVAAERHTSSRFLRYSFGTNDHARKPWAPLGALVVGLCFGVLYAWMLVGTLNPSNTA